MTITTPSSPTLSGKSLGFLTLLEIRKAVDLDSTLSSAQAKMKKLERLHDLLNQAGITSSEASLR